MTNYESQPPCVLSALCEFFVTSPPSRWIQHWRVFLVVWEFYWNSLENLEKSGSWQYSVVDTLSRVKIFLVVCRTEVHGSLTFMKRDTKLSWTHCSQSPKTSHKVVWLGDLNARDCSMSFIQLWVSEFKRMSQRCYVYYDIYRDSFKLPHSQPTTKCF